MVMSWLFYVVIFESILLISSTPEVVECVNSIRPITSTTKTTKYPIEDHIQRLRTFGAVYLKAIKESQNIEKERVRYDVEKILDDAPTILCQVFTLRSSRSGFEKLKKVDDRVLLLQSNIIEVAMEIRICFIDLQLPKITNNSALLKYLPGSPARPTVVGLFITKKDVEPGNSLLHVIADVIAQDFDEQIYPIDQAINSAILKLPLTTSTEKISKRKYYDSTYAATTLDRENILHHFVLNYNVNDKSWSSELNHQIQSWNLKMGLLLQPLNEFYLSLRLSKFDQIYNKIAVPVDSEKYAKTFRMKCGFLLSELIENAFTVAKEISRRFFTPSPRQSDRMQSMHRKKHTEVRNLLTSIVTEHIYPLQSYLWDKSGYSPAVFQTLLKNDGASFWLMPIHATYQTLSLFECQAKRFHSLLPSSPSFLFVALLCPFTFASLREQFEKTDGKEIAADSNTFIAENAASVIQQAESQMKKTRKSFNNSGANQDLMAQAKAEFEVKKKEIIDPLLELEKNTAAELFHVQLQFYRFVNEVNEICRLKLVESYKRCGAAVDESKIDI